MKETPLQTTSQPAPRVIVLRNAAGLALRLMDHGATWLSCEVPMPDGGRREVLLGCATPEDYSRQSAYLGATIGRYANRIGESRIEHGGQAWALTPQPGSRHQLHGGPDGFDRRVWTVEQVSDTAAVFSIVSPEGDQGYPGRLEARVTYRLLDDDSIEMLSEARVDAASPVCLTNHAYFNLDGQPGDVRRHRLQVASDRYLPVDADLLALGGLAPVDGSGFDFRQPKTLAQDWLCDTQQHVAGGYDHAFLLDPACRSMDVSAAELVASDERLRMRVMTTLPALQLYAGQFLGGTPKREGGSYAPCSGVALEPGFLPDSPNHPEWPQPSCWLQPDQTYRHVIRYRFIAT